MRDFRVIYKILKAFKDTLHDNVNPYDLIEPEVLGTSKRHVDKLLHMLCDAKLLKTDSNANTSITLAGLEYLKDNATMQEIAKE